MVKKRTGRPNLLGDDSRRVTFDLPGKEHQSLDSLAAGAGVSMATVLRWAVEDYLKDYVAATVATHEKQRLVENAAAMALHQFVQERARKTKK